MRIGFLASLSFAVSLALAGAAAAEVRIGVAGPITGANAAFGAQLGGPGVEGTLMTFGPEPRRNPNAAEAVAAFKAKGFEPQGYTLYSYAGVQILKQAAEKAKSLDPKKVAEVMHSGVPFHTVIGDIAFDRKGDRTTVDYVWYVWKKGPDGKIGFEML